MSLVPKTPTNGTPAAPSRPMHWSTDPACWRSYAEALIYGAATSPACYAREVERRRKGASMAVAERYGRELGLELRAMFPEAQGIIALARAATGEDLSPKARAERWAATVARCAAWLPKPPPEGRQLVEAERQRRSGITDEQRMAQAVETAGAL